VKCMSHLYAWLGLSPFDIDPNQLATGKRESDSHYRMKYPHQQSARVVTPTPHAVPPRIQKQIETVWAWFYQFYYGEKTS
jgi:sulfotransferase